MTQIEIALYLYRQKGDCLLEVSCEEDCGLPCNSWMNEAKQQHKDVAFVIPIAVDLMLSHMKARRYMWARDMLQKQKPEDLLESLL